MEQVDQVLQGFPFRLLDLQIGNVKDPLEYLLLAGGRVQAADLLPAVKLLGVGEDGSVVVASPFLKVLLEGVDVEDVPDLALTDDAFFQRNQLLVLRLVVEDLLVDHLVLIGSHEELGEERH